MSLIVAFMRREATKTSASWLLRSELANQCSREEFARPPARSLSDRKILFCRLYKGNLLEKGQPLRVMIVEVAVVVVAGANSKLVPHLVE